jgi:hypothetical protein
VITTCVFSSVNAQSSRSPTSAELLQFADDAQMFASSGDPYQPYADYSFDDDYTNYASGPSDYDGVDYLKVFMYITIP